MACACELCKWPRDWLSQGPGRDACINAKTIVEGNLCGPLCNQTFPLEPRNETALGAWMGTWTSTTTVTLDPNATNVSNDSLEEAEGVENATNGSNGTNETGTRRLLEAGLVVEGGSLLEGASAYLVSGGDRDHVLGGNGGGEVFGPGEPSGKSSTLQAWNEDWNAGVRSERELAPGGLVSESWRIPEPPVARRELAAGGDWGIGDVTVVSRGAYAGKDVAVAPLFGKDVGAVRGAVEDPGGGAMGRIFPAVEDPGGRRSGPAEELSSAEHDPGPGRSVIHDLLFSGEESSKRGGLRGRIAR